MSSTGMPIVMSSQKCGPLTGEAHVPGDKSISHRALILGALAVATLCKSLSADPTG